MSKTIRHRKEKRINAISVRSNVILLIVLTLLAALCVLPVLLVVIVSFSSEQSIFLKGYSFFPAEFSLEAYKFFLRLGDQIVRSYAITLFVTVFGTLFSLAVTTMLSYVLSRPDYRYGRILTLLLLFTMLFNGGLVPSYMVNTQILGLRDTVWALIFPMSLNVFYVVVLRTFFKGIPLEIIEAAHMDGAGEFYTFLRVVLPLSKPGVATIGLFTVIAYWNSPAEHAEQPGGPDPVLSQCTGICGNGKKRAHGQRTDGSDGAGGAAGHAGLPLLPEIFCKGTYRRRCKGLSISGKGCAECGKKMRL